MEIEGWVLVHHLRTPHIDIIYKRGRGDNLLEKLGALILFIYSWKRKKNSPFSLVLLPNNPPKNPTIISIFFRITQHRILSSDSHFNALQFDLFPVVFGFKSSNSPRLLTDADEFSGILVSGLCNLRFLISVSRSVTIIMYRGKWKV